MGGDIPREDAIPYDGLPAHDTDGAAVTDAHRLIGPVVLEHAIRDRGRRIERVDRTAVGTGNRIGRAAADAILENEAVHGADVQTAAEEANPAVRRDHPRRRVHRITRGEGLVPPPEQLYRLAHGDATVVVAGHHVDRIGAGAGDQGVRDAVRRRGRRLVRRRIRTRLRHVADLVADDLEVVSGEAEAIHRSGAGMDDQAGVFGAHVGHDEVITTGVGNVLRDQHVVAVVVHAHPDVDRGSCGAGRDPVQSDQIVPPQILRAEQAVHDDLDRRRRVFQLRDTDSHVARAVLHLDVTALAEIGAPAVLDDPGAVAAAGAIVISDDQHQMVRAVAGHVVAAAAVVLELRAGIDPRADRSGLQRGLDLGQVVADRAVARDVRVILEAVLQAGRSRRVARLVRVAGLQHATVVLPDPVGRSRPAAVAPRTVRVAGNRLLLGKIHGHPVVDLDESLHLGRGGERPARSAGALILDRRDAVHIAPIQTGGQVLFYRQDLQVGLPLLLEPFGRVIAPHILPFFRCPRPDERVVHLEGPALDHRPSLQFLETGAVVRPRGSRRRQQHTHERHGNQGAAVPRRR